MNLQYEYRDCVMEYVSRFLTKQDLTGDIDFDLEWLSTDQDYNFQLGDIRYDIDNDIPAGLILKWYSEQNVKINYKNYTKLCKSKN